MKDNRAMDGVSSRGGSEASNRHNSKRQGICFDSNSTSLFEAFALFMQK